MTAFQLLPLRITNYGVFTSYPFMWDTDAKVEWTMTDDPARNLTPPEDSDANVLDDEEIAAEGATAEDAAPVEDDPSQPQEDPT